MHCSHWLICRPTNRTERSAAKSVRQKHLSADTWADKLALTAAVFFSMSLFYMGRLPKVGRPFFVSADKSDREIGWTKFLSVGTKKTSADVNSLIEKVATVMRWLLITTRFRFDCRSNAIRNCKSTAQPAMRYVAAVACSFIIFTTQPFYVQNIQRRHREVDKLTSIAKATSLSFFALYKNCVQLNRSRIAVIMVAERVSNRFERWWIESRIDVE